MTDNNYETTKAKAESQRGRWFTDRLEIFPSSKELPPTDYYYCYAVEFDENGNDWELQLYKIDSMFNTISQDTIYLEDVAEFFKRISRKTGMKVYNNVKTYIEKLFESKPEDLENVL